MADTEAPKILGKLAGKPKDNEDAWVVEFHSLSAWVELSGDLWDGFVGDTCVCVGEALHDAIAAIERELLAVRAAIPEGGKETLCSACKTRPPRFLDGQCQHCGEGGK